MIRTCMLALSVVLSTSLAAFEFNQSNSELKFTGTYDGEPINGVFKTFSGKVDFTTADFTAPQFDVRIQINSLDSQYPERDDMLKSAEWFDSAKYPTAAFKSGPCKLTKKTCAGSLTIRDKTVPTTITLTVAADGKSMTGSASLKRSAFGIGTGEWEEAGVIGQEVGVAFTIKALPAK
jgi:polyisoprenoid-binding protein YceI